MEKIGSYYFMKFGVNPEITLTTSGNVLTYLIEMPKSIEGVSTTGITITPKTTAASFTVQLTDTL